MYVFGQRSSNQLITADTRLQEIAREAIQVIDHSVIKGFRSEAEQNAAFKAGHSKLRWPDGNHNDYPSLALDIQVHPRPKSDQELRESQLYLLGIYRGIALIKDIPLRTGADWDRDGEIADNGFDDFFHVEIDE